jgi:hypothetical protein
MRTSRVPSEVLTASIARFRAELSASGQLNSTDNGRLVLLQQSVDGGDWFFQALHQLFCLRSIDASQLPRSVRNINPDGFIHLEKLLCSNTTASPAFIKFASEFPEPLMDLYSDPDIKYRDTYEQRLARVRLFIDTLAVRWEPFISRHIKVFSPPLVQEMVEELHLHTSPVLQKVLFTAVARMFWQCGDCPALNALFNLHELDSRSYAAGHIRTDTEKLVAKSHLRLIYDDWNARGLADPESRNAPYEAPPEIVHWFFSTIPQPVNGQHAQQPQNVAHPSNSARGASSASPTLRLRTSRQNSLANVSNTTAPSSPSMARIQQQGTSGRPSASRTVSAQNRPVITPLAPNAMLPTQQDRRPIQLQLQQQRQQQQQHQLQHVQQQLQLQQQMLHQQQQQQQMHVQRQTQIVPPRSQLRKLFPTESAGPASQPTHPDTIKSGLHQAHLRSPVLIPSPLRNSEGDPERKTASPTLPLYLHVVGYGLPPTMLLPHALQTISFHVSAKAIARLPKRSPSNSSSIKLTTETSLYRLRCCSATVGVGFPSENAWITADTIWPTEITSLEFNGAILETRNKLHYGKYLPINVTELLREGKNVLVIGIDANVIKRNKKHYAIALEAVSAKDHQGILDGLIRPTLQQSRDAIIGRSSSSVVKGEDAEMKDASAIADDELTITSTAQTISLLDPYTASRAVALPVRGKFCLHRDPFDLETFLSQLPPAQNPRLYSPPPTPGSEGSSVTHPDAWRCPRCRADIRPQNLTVDAFLVDVLAKLKAEGKLEGENSARAIQVQPDGSWEVKKEAGAERMSGVEKTSSQKVIEVIELD